MNPISSLTIPKIVDITKIPMIEKWWARNSAFQDWFLNFNENNERIQYLFTKGLDAIEQVLEDPNANASAKANILKLLAEMQGMVGKRQTEKFADEQINNMTVEQLQSYLRQKGVKITEEIVLDASTTKPSSKKS